MPCKQTSFSGESGNGELFTLKNFCLNNIQLCYFIVTQVPKVTLMRQTSHDLAIVSDLYSLLEDFMTMAHSSKSLLCCQPAGIQTVLMCELCGDNFAGKADRMLKLCKHFQLAHPSDALKLILDAIKRYGKLIGHMRKALDFDKWFGEINYAPNLRNKSFECSKCQEKQS